MMRKVSQATYLLIGVGVGKRDRTSIRRNVGEGVENVRQRRGNNIRRFYRKELRIRARPMNA